MKRAQIFLLVDETGRPLSPHIAEALISLVPRFQREFPLIRDLALLMDVLEEAGRRILKRETRSGPIEHLHGYAWVTLRSVGRSWQRRGSSRLELHTLSGDHSAAALKAMAGREGAPEQIERDILLQEVLVLMTSEERLVCTRKQVGFSSRKLGRLRGTSAGAIDTFLSRTRARLKTLLNGPPGDRRQDDAGDRAAPERPASKRRRTANSGKIDDE